MQVIKGQENFNGISDRLTCAIGAFDGLHKGHLKIIRYLKELSKRNGTKSAILTFEPIPRHFFQINQGLTNLLNPEVEGNILTPLCEKIELIKKEGIDYLLIIPFTLKFSTIKYTDFFYEIFVKRLNVERLIVGVNFFFGYKKRGNVLKLNKLCQSSNIALTVVDEYIENGEVVSSTLVREELKNGNIKKVNQLLGREYFLKGIVVKGDGIGRKIGFPTANIFPLARYKLKPARGVYFAKIIIKNNSYFGVLNLGKAPTFNYNKHKLEIFIFDFDSNIYGEIVSVGFLERLRNIKKFDTVEELKIQIKQDINICKSLIKSGGLYGSPGGKV